MPCNTSQNLHGSVPLKPSKSLPLQCCISFDAQKASVPKVATPIKAKGAGTLGVAILPAAVEVEVGAEVLGALVLDPVVVMVEGLVAGPV